MSRNPSAFRGPEASTQAVAPLVMLVFGSCAIWSISLFFPLRIELDLDRRTYRLQEAFRRQSGTFAEIRALRLTKRRGRGPHRFIELVWNNENSEVPVYMGWDDAEARAELSRLSAWLGIPVETPDD